MHKIKQGLLTEETVKKNSKRNFGRFVGSEIKLSLISSVKETPTFWKQFLHVVLTMVKQLEIPTCFLTLPCATPRFEELPYIINKINNLELSDKEWKKLCCQEQWNQLNNNQILVARHLKYKIEVSFEKDCTWWYTGQSKIFFYAYWILRKGQRTCLFLYMDFQCTKDSKWG